MTAYSPTEAGARLAAFVARYNEQHGYGPSVREMQAILGVASSSGVHRVVNQLKERGIVVYLPRCARSIRLTDRPVVIRVPANEMTNDELLAECAQRGLVGR